MSTTSGDAFPRITFGIIVLNGEPFTRYCLRSLYRFAHEIIVVEGGHEETRSVATADGHSVDGTLEALWRFKREEDPQDKLSIVTNDGFWPRKQGPGDWRTLQSRAYAERASGDYLWQVDIDEFYRPEDMETVLRMLAADPSISGMSFETLTFWGSPRYTVDGWPLRRGAATYHRLFKWGSGYEYIRHEPPTVLDEQRRDLRDLNWIGGAQTAREGIVLYHYSLLFPGQVRQKCQVYRDERPDYCAEILDWANGCYFKLGNPYRVHNVYEYPSWLERFHGDHPSQIEAMQQDIAAGRLKIELRETEDVERLLRSPIYSLGRRWVKAWDYCDRGRMSLVRSLRNRKRRLTALLQHRLPLAQTTRTRQGGE